MKKFVESIMSVKLTNKIYNQHKILCAKHRLAQSKYEKQQSAFNETIKYIQIRISSENATFIEKIKTHP